MDRLEGTGGGREKVLGREETEPGRFWLGSLAGGRVVVKTELEEQAGPLHREPRLGVRGLGSGPRPTVRLWTLGSDLVPFWPMDLVSEATGRSLRPEFAQTTTGQVCASRRTHPFASKKITSSPRASLKIQLCDVNGISLQKKEMRLASVLPGKES